MFGRGLFDFRTREEKERDFDAFYKKVLPGGEEQKKRLRERLSQEFPGKDGTYIFTFYLSVKELMLDDGELGFWEAAKTAARRLTEARLDLEEMGRLKRVMEEDMGEER